MKCPYCQNDMGTPPPEYRMSVKRQEILAEIVKAGPRGIKRDLIMKKFLPGAKSRITMRTTIHHINKVIKPMRILSVDNILMVEESGVMATMGF